MTTEALINYLKQLVIDHPEFAHTETHQAFFKFDYSGMMSLKKSRSQTVLYVHRIKGGYRNNKGDYKSKQYLIAIRVMEMLPTKALMDPYPAILRCEQYGEEFFDRMEHDRDTSVDPDICSLLKHVDIDQIMFEQLELQADGWTGMEFVIPLRAHKSSTYDPAIWA